MRYTHGQPCVCVCVCVCVRVSLSLAILCHSPVLQHIATPCSTLQHTATHCKILQHPALPCNTMQHRPHPQIDSRAGILACVRVCVCVFFCPAPPFSNSLTSPSHPSHLCDVSQSHIFVTLGRHWHNTLQHSAPHFTTLQHCNTATLQHCNILQHTAKHRNTLKHSATHCNTLQHRPHRWR